MKRRIIKRRIRQAERVLAATLQSYLNLPPETDQESREEFIHGELRVYIDILLGWLLELNPGWPSRVRWVDGVSLSDTSVIEPLTFMGRGDLWWGLLEDVGGEEWAEPFEVLLRLSKRGNRLASYEIEVGEGEERFLFIRRATGLTYARTEKHN